MANEPIDYSALLEKTRRYEQAAISREDWEAVEFHQGVRETIEIATPVHVEQGELVMEGEA